MNLKKSISPAEVDFWLDVDKYSNYLEDQASNSPTGNLVFNIDMVRLSSIRKAISNFVRILTRKNIPVYFNAFRDVGINDGQTVYITSEINNKQDFDVTVGLALHEGAHCFLTDFDVVKIAWANIPHSIWKKSDAKNIRRNVMERFIFDTWNVIEDRYIDDFVFRTAPGYRGYYSMLYERFWNNPAMDEYLKSDYLRYPSLKSYSFRIGAFINENTDLLALPRLDEIADLIDIEHISRLRYTKDRIDLAFKVTEIVLDCIDRDDLSLSITGGSGEKGTPKQMDGLADPDDFFDFGDEPAEEEPPPKDVDMEQKMMQEISDAISGRDEHPDEPKDSSSAVDKISNDPISKEIQKEIDEMIKKQREFLSGNIPKQEVTDQQQALLDLIEKHGIVLVRVDLPETLAGDDKNLKVDCIVVQKMTKELVFSGADVFPLSTAMKMGDVLPVPPKENWEAVSKGIRLGTKLGRKLQIRAEVNPYKIVRKKSGKINRRQLHEAASDAEDLFYKINVEEHNDANMHITVDASSSMCGDKWYRTMTAVVAICKAASMIDNIHITVSFRATQNSGQSSLPYIVLAYDSKVDKFSKIKNLFPYLSPHGCTPEGLAFSATMNLFENMTPDEEDRYFLNLSDGEPYYALSIPHLSGGIKNIVSISYTGSVGVNHTKSQVDKIRRHGVEILSYFIGEGAEHPLQKKNTPLTPEEKKIIKEWQAQVDSSYLRKNFKRMYGKNAKFIDVESIIDLARTINGLFLARIHEKRA